MAVNGDQWTQSDGRPLDHPSETKDRKGAETEIKMKKQCQRGWRAGNDDTVCGPTPTREGGREGGRERKVGFTIN